MSAQSTLPQDEDKESMNSLVEFLKNQRIEYDETTLVSETIANYQQFVEINQNQEFDWQKLSDCFEHIFILYTEEVALIRTKMDQNLNVCDS